jgi:hypothetical protein
MMETYIPPILRENGFRDYKFLRVLSDDESEAISFALQFTVDSIDHFLAYQDGPKKINAQKMNSKYGNSCLSFSTLMEIHDEG